MKALVKIYTFWRNNCLSFITSVTSIKAETNSPFFNNNLPETPVVTFWSSIKNGENNSFVYQPTTTTQGHCNSGRSGTMHSLCLISRYNSEIMRLATIDPHSQKVHTKLHKIHKFRPNIKQDTAI